MRTSQSLHVRRSCRPVPRSGPNGWGKGRQGRSYRLIWLSAQRTDNLNSVAVSRCRVAPRPRLIWLNDAHEAEAREPQLRT